MRLPACMTAGVLLVGMGFIGVDQNPLTVLCGVTIILVSMISMYVYIVSQTKKSLPEGPDTRPRKKIPLVMPQRTEVRSWKKAA